MPPGRRDERKTDKLEFIDLKTQYAALKGSVCERMQAVLDHGQYIIDPEVKELEGRLAAYTGVWHCVTVASGTEALLIAMMALGLKPGDEVITTPFTLTATGEMIVLLGARPVFVYIEPGTCNIDASQIEARVTARTRAIMPVAARDQVMSLPMSADFTDAQQDQVVAPLAQALRGNPAPVVRETALCP